MILYVFKVFVDIIVDKKIVIGKWRTKGCGLYTRLWIITVGFVDNVENLKINPVSAVNNVCNFVDKKTPTKHGCLWMK